jgi:molecular chaperone DnaK
MSKVIGCDLGTTNSVTAIRQQDTRLLPSRENQDSIPSVVGSHRDQIIVGSLAVDRMLSAPENTIVSIKRLIGRAYRDPEVDRVKSRYLYKVVPPTEGTDDDLRVVLAGKQYSPIEISSHILKKVKEDAELRLNDTVEFAVITVPAYFSDKQRDATRKAGQMAGLKVQKILDEPTAAAIAFGVDNVGANDAANILVYDLGGGTFDISVLTVVGGIFAQLDIEGDMWMGGDDFDHKIMDHVIAQVNATYEVDAYRNKRFLIELKRRAEQAKKALSSMASVDITVLGLLQDKDGNLIDVEVELTRDQFESMIRPDVERTIELVRTAIDNARMEIGHVDHVLLVGGSSCIPLVRKSLAVLFGESKLRTDVDPMKCVAFGAAALAAKYGAQVECSNGHVNPGAALTCEECGEPLVDTGQQIEIGSITAMDYGIETTGDKFEPIIPKGSPYPSPEPVVKTFRTPSSGLRRMKVPVYAGQNPTASKNELQITVWLELPAGVPENTPLDVSLKLDKDCVIERVKVSLKDGSGRQIEVYPDRGGDRRSRLEKKLEAVKQQWDQVRAKADLAAVRQVEAIYEDVIKAANAGRLDDADARLQDMKKEVDKTEETQWKKRATGIVNYSQLALDVYGWMIDANQAGRIKRLIAELQAAIDSDDNLAADRKYAELDRETDTLPGIAIDMMAMERAIHLAHQAGDLSAADRLRVALNETASAAKRGDQASATAKVKALLPLINAFLKAPNIRSATKEDVPR